MTQNNPAKVYPQEKEKKEKKEATKTPAKTKAAKRPVSRTKPPPQKPTGRPCEFTDAMGDLICERLASGESLRSICRDETMPPQSTVFRWLHAVPRFREQYTRARECQQDAMAEEILAIADDGINDTYVDDDGSPRVDNDVIQRSRLRVDTRKWLMSKMAPKRFGDKVDVNHGAQPDNPLTVLLQQVQGTPMKPDE